MQIFYILFIALKYRNKIMLYLHLCHVRDLGSGCCVATRPHFFLLIQLCNTHADCIQSNNCIMTLWLFTNWGGKEFWCKFYRESLKLIWKTSINLKTLDYLYVLTHCYIINAITKKTKTNTFLVLQMTLSKNKLASLCMAFTSKNNISASQRTGLK